MKRIVLLLPVLLFSSSLVAQTYGRAGLAFESSPHVTLRDTNCSSTQPPALFGCGSGNDGLPFGASGEVKRGRTFEVAAGRESGRIRVELLATSRTGFELDAQSNFPVAGQQPVSARIRSMAVLLAGAVDLTPKSWRVRPFLTAGAGIARNELSAVTFAFPGIAAGAVTITRGGRSTGLAWTAGAGVTMDITGQVSLDLTAGYTDLGRLPGDRGGATIVRPTRKLTLDIAAIEMKWRTRGVSLSVRRKF